LSVAFFLEALANLSAGAEPDRREVVVIVRQDNLSVPDLGRAERTAARILASIGVAVKFRAGAERTPNGAGDFRTELQLEAKAPAQFRSGVLAYSLPFGLSGTRIHIYCDRVRGAWRDTGAGTVLGYVMAHEIAHVLEGVNRHSAEGVMKERWENPDYRQMESGTLCFDPVDADLIHAALEKKATQAASAKPAPR
jgi:hypothetical protein